jgi:glucosamine--fructose-6-phosphate aminotransferase (isomerizing)
VCGIFACVAEHGDTVDVVLAGLRRLEYRGYDSTGLGATAPGESRLNRVRAQGGVDVLVDRHGAQPLRGSLAVGHTRWATHGAPSPANAHPHVDCSGRLGIVHNGIVENFAELRAALSGAGHDLVSATDTELLVHLMEQRLAETGGTGVDGLVESARFAVIAAHGAHACVIFAAGHPDVLLCVRRGTAGGLRIASGEGRAYVASDGAALAAAGAGSACVVPPDTVAVVRPGSVAMYGLYDAAPVAVRWAALPKPVTTAETSGGVPERTAFFREAREQPTTLARQARTVQQLVRGRLTSEVVRNGDRLGQALRRRRIRAVRLLACGTPMYACLAGRDYVQTIAGIPAVVELAHEFAHSRYAMAFDTDLVIVVSQSGETADSLLALQKAASAGALCVAVTNTVDSSLDQAADVGFYTRCGPEFSVAQTKAFTGAVVTLLGVACLLAHLGGSLEDAVRDRVDNDTDQLPAQASRALQLAHRDLPPVVESLTRAGHCLFLGRGLSLAAALEGALKLKELSYLHAEGYAAGELKHGPIALIEPGFPVVAVVCRDETRPKMLSQLAEVAARGAQVIVVAEESDEEARAAASLRISVPDGSTGGLLAPVITVIPLQLLAGFVARARGNDVDRPRNLAKSVTVI